ncbi:putative leader peptide [Amycolatopsis sp. NPDC058986]|uniref:putative leader peptide n=1 Tax=unclassified Amycolatopsis TaxID=2618356 RepID=UPI0036729B63
MPEEQRSDRLLSAGPVSTSTFAGREGAPTIRARLDHIVGTWHPEPVTPAGVPLVARRHVDLLRVASALCGPAD